MSRPRLISIIVLGALSVVAGAAGQPPQELADYVRDARKAGVNENRIQQNALHAGWSAPAIRDALAAPPAVAPGEQTDAAASAGEVKKSVTQAAPAPGIPIPANAAAEPATQPRSVDRGVPDDYVIGEGDVLHISVWKEPDASVPSVVVRPDGKISMPMLKEVQVSGLTPAVAEKSITEQLSKFISAADVTVIVSGIHSKKIYVVGGVKKEGPIPYTYRMTILQALSEAGGLTDYAKKKRIYVLRHENGREYQLPFDYDAVLKGERMELNIPLLPGDTLVVPK